MTGKKVWCITGAGSIGRTEQIDAYRDLSTSLALNDLQPTGDRR